MNLGLAYSVFDRASILVRQGKKSEEILKEVHLKYPELQEYNLEEIIKLVSENFSR